MSENEEFEKNEVQEINEIPESDEERNFLYYVNRYRGAIIGGVVALLLIATGLSKFLIGLVIIAVGVFLGNYIQKNKSNVKETLKEFIDKF